jgi:hypothetical protein
VYIHSRLYEQFSVAQAAFGTTFRNTGSYQKAGTSSPKRVTGRIFIITVVISFTKKPKIVKTIKCSFKK